MSAMSHEQFCRIEANMRYATDQIRPLCEKQMRDDLHTAQYLLSVVRQYAGRFETYMTEDERIDALKDLYSALYR